MTVLLIIAIVFLLFRCFVLKQTVNAFLDLIKKDREITTEKEIKDFKDEFEKQIKSNLKHH